MHIPPEWLPAEDGPCNRPPAAAASSTGPPRLWLIAGTGEGPALAERLLARGWRLRVSVVTPAAVRAYRPHPGLELRVGPLGESEGEAPGVAVARELRAAEESRDPFQWLLDASHPFATRISAALAEACLQRRQPLLRLLRPPLPPGRAELLRDLVDLQGRCRGGERLLLAIGARHLAAAIAASPGALHHARLLPSPQALRQALAVGLGSGRLACLRPDPASEAIEMALCRRWRIDTVLCRQSGGDSEGRWHRISEALGLRLLLLQRPPEPAGVIGLAMPELLERVGAPAAMGWGGADPVARQS
jgi:precorrin-6A/cobalt-precorrin-6A reductase